VRTRLEYRGILQVIGEDPLGVSRDTPSDR
jgi:hypothetical protein